MANVPHEFIEILSPVGFALCDFLTAHLCSQISPKGLSNDGTRSCLADIQDCCGCR
jgi:hypothetical protein